MSNAKKKNNFDLPTTLTVGLGSFWAYLLLFSDFPDKASWTQTFLSVAAIYFGFRAIRFQHKLEKEHEIQKDDTRSYYNTLRVIGILGDLVAAAKMLQTAKDDAEMLRHHVSISMTDFFVLEPLQQIRTIPFDVVDSVETMKVINMSKTLGMLLIELHGTIRRNFEARSSIDECMNIVGPLIDKFSIWIQKGENLKNDVLSTTTVKIRNM